MLSPSIFHAFHALGVIIPRFTVTGVLAKPSPVMATIVLLADMCLSLAAQVLGVPDGG